MLLGPREPELFLRLASRQLEVFSPAPDGLDGIEPLIDERQLIGRGGIVWLQLQSPFKLIARLIVGAFEQQRQAEVVGQRWVGAVRELGSPQRRRGGRK